MEWQNGIDTIAHKTALEKKGKTLAVLGNGLENIYPKENIGLYKDIIENEGLIITEYPPNIKATSENFLNRNRIVSAIALGILVIESTYRSGTSVTAKFAKKQNKRIFAIPHELEDKYGIGTNKLIQKGAILVTSVKDIIQEFEFLSFNEKKDKKEIENFQVEEKHKKKECINMDYNEIYKHINYEVITINEIYKKTQKSISEINSILIMLEIEGYIRKVAGGYKCVF